MKNNKGYYSWIHSLKAASMESHFKGKKMLQESNAYLGIKPTDLETAHKELMTTSDGPGRPTKGPHIDPKHPSDVSKTSAEIYAEIHAAKKSRDMKPTAVDINQDGRVDAIDVQADGSDNNIEDEDTPIDPNLFRPSSKLARQARKEAGLSTPEDLEETDYEAKKEAEQLDIDSIIHNIMRGKR